MMMNKLKALIILLAISACAKLPPEVEKDVPETPSPAEPAPCFSSFKLEAKNNHGLSRDYIGTIDNTGIHIFCPELDLPVNVVASFEGDYVQADIDGLIQESGVSKVKFEDAVHYRLTGPTGQTALYPVFLVTRNGLPCMNIDTDGEPILDKDNYVRAQITINNIPEQGSIHSPAKIRGRGNGTWGGYPKKPYKIKFDSKISPFGFPKNKDWVILADYTDKSLLRTAWMVELSKAVEMPYTAPYQHIDTWLNGEYIGTYILTDHVEKAKNRINIQDDGFIIQNDNAISDELFYFRTKKQKYSFTFKYPDPDDGEIVQGDETYLYIEKLMNDFETVLYDDLPVMSNPDTGYRAFIEPESFAKWYLIFEITLNYEPNLYFVCETRDAKMQMYPAWDAEWSLGLAYRPEAYGGWVRYPDGEPDNDDIFWSRGKYLAQLFRDPYFVSIVKEEWAKLKPRIPQVRAAVSRVREQIDYSRRDNFKRWDIIRPDYHPGVSLKAWSTWEEEADYTFAVFDHRVEVVGNYIESL